MGNETASIETQLQQRLNAGLALSHLEIINESHMHSGSRMDTHYKLVAVSDDFVGKRLIQRHQAIYALVAELMNNPIHALSMHLYSEAEWTEKQGVVPESPNCMGGSKR